MPNLEFGIYCKPVINIRLADVSQWDETTCDQAVCQHPHCWATIRRLQRGHHKILEPVLKTSKEKEDELPTLKLVDLSLPDSSILAKRIDDSLSFLKHRAYLTEDSKYDSILQNSLEEPQLLRLKSLKGFHRPGFAQQYRKPAKLPVLNLNATHLPKCPNVGNLVMVWIPDEKHKKLDGICTTNLVRMSPDKKSIVPLKISRIIPCKEWISKRTVLKKRKSTKVPTGGQPCSSQLMQRWLKVPPPSPVTPPSYSHLESSSSWACVFPKHSLMSSLPDEEKTVASSKMDQLDIINEESLCQERHRFSVSKTKVILAVHRINLQSPVLRYPANIKELYSREARRTPKLKTEGNKDPVQKVDKTDRRPSSKSGTLQTSETDLKEEPKKRSRELLELPRIYFSGSSLETKDSIVSSKEGLLKEDVTDQMQLLEHKYQEVQPEGTSEAPQAIQEKNFWAEAIETIQIPHAFHGEQEYEPLTPPSSRE